MPLQHFKFSTLTRNVARRVALAYLVVGVFWILGTDLLLAALPVSGPTREQLEVGKGWLFIAVTAGLLWALITHYLRELQAKSELLLSFADTIATKVGSGFFGELAQQLAGTLPADYVHIAELNPDATLGALGCWLDGQPAEAVYGGLPGSPCAVVLATGAPLLLADCQRQFPHHGFLTRLGFTAYYGVPLLATNGETLGLIALLNRAPFADPDLVVALAGACAARAGAELERSRSERCRLELAAAVEKRAQALELANHDLDGFAHTVAHDLRTPLTTISCYAQIAAELDDSYGQGHLRQLMAEVVTTTERMDQTLTGLLDFATLGTRALNRSPVDLTGQAAEILAGLRLAEPERDLEVTLEPGLTAVADPQLTYLVLQNLLGNAWKFTHGREQGRIEFFRLPEGRLCVQDNGPGFASADAERIFLPFARLATGQPGHGIGLATTRKIIDRHGGGICAVRDAGTTRFLFDFGVAGADGP